MAHQEPPPRGRLNANQLRHALTTATDDELAYLRRQSDRHTRRTIQLHTAIEAEIERRHWPGRMTAAA